MRVHHGEQTQWDALHRRHQQFTEARFEHREGLVPGFTTKYGSNILVWYELHETMTDAIARQKQIKAGSRMKKLALIESLNPEWEDLFETLV